VNGLSSTSHLIGLAAAAVAIGTLVPLARLRPGGWVAVVCRALAIALVGNVLGLQVMFARAGTWSVSSSLPLYICDIAAVVAAFALVWPKRLLVELTWFWAIGAALLGVIFPDHAIAFPSYDWAQYYIEHGGVLLAGVLLVVGLRRHPQSGAVIRVIAVTFASVATVGAIDGITGANYDYLRPIHVVSGSLLNLLGPWPWYIIVAAGGEIVFLTILDLPFWPERHRAKRAAATVSSSLRG
jgi:hypothetical integral membrane protein (TIGR02206 family)